MKCSNCGKEWAKPVNFCGVCGSRLNASADAGERMTNDSLADQPLFVLQEEYHERLAKAGLAAFHWFIGAFVVFFIFFTIGFTTSMLDIHPLENSLSDGQRLLGYFVTAVLLYVVVIRRWINRKMLKGKASEDTYNFYPDRVEYRRKNGELRKKIFYKEVIRVEHYQDVKQAECKVGTLFIERFSDSDNDSRYNLKIPNISEHKQWREKILPLVEKARMEDDGSEVQYEEEKEHKYYKRKGQ